MSSRSFLHHILGGGSVQFSRPGFKIAVIFNTGGSDQPMIYEGYAHYRSRGMRCLWNYYNTSTTINPSEAATGATNSLHYLATNTYVNPGGGNYVSVHDVWPIMDMLYTDIEISGPLWNEVDASDITCTAGNGGVSGTTLTVTANQGNGAIVRGARLSGTGITAGTYITNYTNPTITMNQANAVANGTTVTVQGRINDIAALRFAIDSQMPTEMAGNPGVTKLIGTYSNTPGGIATPASYLYWTNTDLQNAAIRAGNDACGKFVAQYNDFILPEFYTTRMDEVSVKAQWLCNEKTRLGLTTKLFPLFWPSAGVSEHSYAICTAYLEYMIRIPEIDGVAFWCVNGTHRPSAAPLWYDDGTFPWIAALQDFIDKYGLSL